MKKRDLRPYHGVIFILCFTGILFGVEPMIGNRMGIYGTAVGELLFLLLSVLFVVATKADFKRVFPLQKPRVSAIFGSLLLWGGTFGIMTVILTVMMYLFPQQAAGASQGLENMTMELPFLLGVLIIAVAPAICEEAVFRGVFMRSLSPIGNKWIVLVITGALFGAFHGNLMKFIPTTMLGILFGYIVWETNNMFYSVLLHFLNNFMSVVALYALQSTMKMTERNPDISVAMDSVQLPLLSVGVYLFMAMAVPFCLYIGYFLLHKGIQGAPVTLFPQEKKTVFWILIGITLCIFLLAVAVCLLSVLVDG
ncbi:MAG: CPBP family intramembrane glutamic endopeptidase [Lachnospiraceae bacterium]